MFVTGGTGFIGSRLVQALAAADVPVRALTRRRDTPVLPGFPEPDARPLDHPRVELVRGDLADPDSLVRAMAGCRRVFHLAGYAKNWSPDPRVYWRVNVDGVKNVVRAAERCAVERVVWTSSVVTLGPTPPGAVADEATPRWRPDYLTEYEASKAEAEQWVLGRRSEGCPVVIVNPTRVYGPGLLTEGNALTQLIVDYLRGKFPVLPNRGVNVGNYVLVDDVVQGHLLAMEKGRPGERYVLGGENATLKEFFQAVRRVTGVRRRQLPLLRFGPLAYAYVLKKRADWFGVYPRITPGWVRTFQTDWAYRCDKARRELGYEPTSLEDGLRRTWDWLQRVGGMV